jgi:hypothetical protein
VLHHDRVAGHGESDDVGGEGRVELGRHAWSEVASVGGERNENGAVSARLGTLRDRCRERFACVPGEAGVFTDHYEVGTVLPKLRGFGSDSGRSREQRMNFTATQRVGHRASGGDGFERDLAQIGSARFRDDENVGHQSTFASFCRSRMSSGIAAVPSPMMRPAGRSGGSSMDFTVTRVGPS